MSDLPKPTLADKFYSIAFGTVVATLVLSFVVIMAGTALTMLDSCF